MEYETQNGYVYKPLYDITKMNYPTVGSNNSSWSDLLSNWAGETFTKDSMFNKKTGWFSPVTSALSGGLQALMAMKMYGLGKDQLAFQQDAFNKNYTMQKSLVQDNLRDIHDRRNSAYTGSEQLALANQGKLISGDDYVKKYIG